jgi:diadenosine tetraphosphate (Ap4A) HIT family hydrolase
MTGFTFGTIPIQASQIFYSSKHSHAFVNLKPILPGHVLVAPNFVKRRLQHLEAAELNDLFGTVQYLIPILEAHFGGTSITMAVQDGAEAGQTVPHVHVHLVPRTAGDLLNNDDVYDELIEFEKDLGNAHYEKEIAVVEKPHGVDFEARPPRSAHEMAEEARQLREFISKWHLRD